MSKEETYSRRVGFIGFFAVFFLIAVFVMGIAITYLGYSITSTQMNSNTNANTISISGSATNTVMPDTATIYFTVSSNSSDYNSAVSSTNSITNELVSKIKSKNPSLSDGAHSEIKIETTSYSVTPTYKYYTIVKSSNSSKNSGVMIPYPEQNSKLVGYKATEVFKLTINVEKDNKNITDPKLLSSASQGYVDIITSKSGVIINSINFKLSNSLLKSIKENLLSQAAANAKQKAQTIAESLGEKISKVKSINSNDLSYYPYPTPVYSSLKTESSSSLGSVISPTSQDISLSLSAEFYVN